MKIGILLTAYNCADKIEEVIKPFQRPEFIISAVSAQFKEFEVDSPVENDATIFELETLIFDKKIQYLIMGCVPKSEVEARNDALAPLLKENCDYIFLLDSDEFYTDKEVDNIIKFIQEQQVAWYSIEFKNYVFTNKTYITGFAPPRIYQNYYNNLKLIEFYEDNGIYYLNTVNKKIDFRTLSSSKIPLRFCNPRHFSWLNNELSKHKYEYQMKRWGSCSYLWNYEKNCLEFNKEYYTKSGQEIPELLTD